MDAELRLPICSSPHASQPLKPPKWIVKSTAGKASRSATREKLLHEHPELNPESEESQFT